MTTPAILKTWEYSLNNAYPAQGSTLLAYRNFWFTFVTWLKSVGWTVRAASNTTTASTSTDWTQQSHLNWGQIYANGNTAHSWIVLRNTNIGPTFDLCIELAQYDAYNGTANGWPQSFGMHVSVGGYNVGGSLVTTLRPATSNSDENTICDRYGSGTSSIWGNGDSALVWHGWSSTDRQCTRAMIYAGDNLVGIFMFDRVNEPTTGWTNPFYSIFRVGGGSAVTMHTAWSSAIMPVRFSTTNTNMFLSSESFGNPSASALLSQQNDFTREYPMYPLGLVCTTAPFRGHHGYVYDAWYSLHATNGMFLPDSTTKQFTLHGGLVLPWNGSSYVKTRL